MSDRRHADPPDRKSEGLTLFHSQQFSDQPLSARPQFGRPQFDHRVLGADNFVLERWIDTPSRPEVKVLRDLSIVVPPDGFALGEDGTLLFDEAPSPALFPIVRGYESWRATARLLNRRGHTVARLDVEIGVGKPGVSIQMRPLARHPHRWSTRRVRRYFALAHEAADEFERVLRKHYETPGARTDAAPAEISLLTAPPSDANAIEALRALTDVLDIDLQGQHAAG